MTSLTYLNVIVQGAVTIDTVLHLEIDVKANEHAVLKCIGIVPENTAFSELEIQLENSEIKVLQLGDDGSPLNTPIFYGIVKTAEMAEENQNYIVKVLALSATCKLDEEKHSRSFQDVSMTYADVIRTVVRDTPEAAAIFPIGSDRSIDKPLIQYQETDWEFFKRLASHFGSALIPESQNGKPWFWFGMRESSMQCSFQELEYCATISEKFYEMGGEAAGHRRGDFFFYQVQSKENLHIGDFTTFLKNNLIICEKKARFEQGEIVFTYKLGKKKLIGKREFYNQKITGLSLQGTVVKTDREIVHIHLDIDGERQDITYPYYWVPHSGNLMYCMPKLGTRASLYIPDHDERNAVATNSPRLNGSICPDMGDYNNRYLTTEHNKRMYFFPKSMGLVGTSSTSTPLHILLDDENYMVFESHGKMELFAMNEVQVTAPNVSLQTPEEVKTVRTSSEIFAKTAMIVPKGTGHE